MAKKKRKYKYIRIPIPTDYEKRKMFPDWFYQNNYYQVRPCWYQCKTNVMELFSSCKSFKQKQSCWRDFYSKYNII